MRHKSFLYLQQVVLTEFESSGAESSIIPDSNISWVLDDSGVLTISGNGSDWRKIHIGELNEKLTSSVINYNSYPEITVTAVKKSAAVSVSYKSECISQPAKVFVVGYKDGKIIDKRITDEKEGVQTLDGVFDEIKVMVWSDFGTLAPLADSVVLADKDWQ